MKKLILASGSRRRAKILSECGINFEIIVSNCDEITEGESAEEVTMANALTKASFVADANPESIVIGTDTLVVYKGEIIGKPENETAARGILEKLLGNVVEVYTGISVIDSDSGEKATGFEKSSLKVREISIDEFKKYFKLLAPYDKAGGFSIEGVGSMLFDNIQGSYFNILGLSMIKLTCLMSQIGCNILDYIDD